MILTFLIPFIYRYHGKRYPWTSNDIKTLQWGMKNLLGRKKFPKQSEIRNAFIDGTVALKKMWQRIDCEDWRKKCVEKVRNMFKTKDK